MTNLPSRSRFPTFRYLFSWRFLRAMIFVLVCFATLIALFYAEEDVRGKRAWDAYVRERTSKGEKIHFSEFIPPPVPDEQNLALCPLLKPLLDLDLRFVTDGKKVRVVRGPNLWRDTNGLNRLQQLNRNWSVTEYYRTMPVPTDPEQRKRRELSSSLAKHIEDSAALTNGWINLEKWAAFYRTGTNLAGFPNTNTPATDVLLALRHLDSDLAELRKEANRRPLARWPVFYNTNDPFGILLPHLARGKSIVALLQLRSAAFLAAGKTEAGLSDLELGFRFAESFRDEPFDISELVRNACYGLLCQPLKEGLARHQFSDEQLIRVQKGLAPVDLLAAYENCMLAERAANSDWNRYLQHMKKNMHWGKTEADNMFGWGPETVLAIIFPSGWIYQNQIVLSRLYDQIGLPSVDVKLRRAFPKVGSNADQIKTNMHGPFNVLANMVFPEGVSPRQLARGQTRLDQAIIACALERHHLIHASYPATLEELTPAFLQKIPHDVISGEPLHYHRTADGGYIIYSIGWNETDDGGLDKKDLDWVWRLPA